MAKGKFDAAKWAEFDKARTEGRSRDALKLRNELIEENRFFAVKMAEQFRLSIARHMDLQDLIQAGTIGVAYAIDHLVPGKGGFAVFAASRIRWELQEASLRDQPIYRSRADYLRQKQIRKMEEIRAKENREATAEELGCTEKALARHHERVRALNVVRADKRTMGDDGVAQRVENLLPSNPSPEDLVFQSNEANAMQIAGVPEDVVELFREKYAENVPYVDLERRTLERVRVDLRTGDATFEPHVHRIVVTQPGTVVAVVPTRFKGQFLTRTIETTKPGQVVEGAFVRIVAEGTTARGIVAERLETKYAMGMRLMRWRRKLERLLHGQETNRRLRQHRGGPGPGAPKSP